MKTVTVSWNRFLTLENKSKRFQKQIKELEKRLDRLTNHINREIGITQKIPLHERIK